MGSLYKQSIPVLVKYLNNLSGLLKKGEAFANEKGMKHEDMLTFRLISDVRGLPYQVQSCCNTAKFLPARVAKTEAVFFEDNETTFEELQSRITKTIELLEAVDPKSFDGKEDAEIVMETKMGNFRFTGQRYVSDYTIPNFHFLLASAYCIMRHLGVPLGALDYLKDVFKKI